jgi:hypothetical protein
MAAVLFAPSSAALPLRLQSLSNQAQVEQLSALLQDIQIVCPRGVLPFSARGSSYRYLANCLLHEAHNIMNIAMRCGHGVREICKISGTTLNADALHRCPNSASQFAQVLHGEHTAWAPDSHCTRDEMSSLPKSSQLVVTQVEILVTTFKFEHYCLAICIRNPWLGDFSGVAHDSGIALTSTDVLFLHLHMLYNIASFRIHAHMHGPQLHEQ